MPPFKSYVPAFPFYTTTFSDEEFNESINKFVNSKSSNVINSSHCVNSDTLLFCAEVETSFFCIYCIHIRLCYYCSGCFFCLNCMSCKMCGLCEDCTDCVNCFNCVNCKNCIGCSNCKNLVDKVNAHNDLENKKCFLFEMLEVFENFKQKSNSLYNSELTIRKEEIEQLFENSEAHKNGPFEHHVISSLCCHFPRYLICCLGVKESIGCLFCIECKYCYSSSLCAYCFMCDKCHSCVFCNNCKCSQNCYCCHNLKGKNHHCQHCIDCTNCVNCFNCVNCKNCIGCSNCENLVGEFNKNNSFKNLEFDDVDYIINKCKTHRHEPGKVETDYPNTLDALNHFVDLVTKD